MARPDERTTGDGTAGQGAARAAHSAGRAADQAASSDWVERLGRAGLAAKGVLYLTIAVLALQLAIGGGGEGDTVGQQGALRALADQPFGTVILALLAIGLAGYALWRLSQAWLDPGDEDGAKAVAQRASYVVRGVVYAGLCVLTVRLLTGGGGGGGGEQEATARLLDLPFGQGLVVLLGLVIVGVGLHQGYRGITKDFAKELATGALPPARRQAIIRLGVVGLCARAVVFTLIGAFLIRAAVTYDPNAAVGLDGALAALAGTAAGPALLGVVAAGLLAYGAFCFAQARYGRIRQMD